MMFYEYKHISTAILLNLLCPSLNNLYKYFILKTFQVFFKQTKILFWIFTNDKMETIIKNRRIFKFFGQKT